MIEIYVHAANFVVYVCARRDIYIYIYIEGWMQRYVE